MTREPRGPLYGQVGTDPVDWIDRIPYGGVGFVAAAVILLAMAYAWVAVATDMGWL